MKLANIKLKVTTAGAAVAIAGIALSVGALPRSQADAATQYDIKLNVGAGVGSVEIGPTSTNGQSASCIRVQSDTWTDTGYIADQGTQYAFAEYSDSACSSYTGHDGLYTCPVTSDTYWWLGLPGKD